MFISVKVEVIEDAGFDIINEFILIIALNGNLPLPEGFTVLNAYDVIRDIDLLDSEQRSIWNRPEGIADIERRLRRVFPRSEASGNKYSCLRVRLLQRVRAVKILNHNYTPPFPNPERKAEAVNLATLSASDFFSMMNPC